jgi:hypothetical protein
VNLEKLKRVMGGISMWLGEWEYYPNGVEESNVLCDLVDVLGSFVSSALMIIWLSRMLGPIIA